MIKDIQQKTNDLLTELGLDSLPQEEREELFAEIGELVFRGALAHAFKVLDIKQQETLTTLLEESAAEPENQEKEEALGLFLQEQVPDFARYIEEEVAALKKKQQHVLSDIG